MNWEALGAVAELLGAIAVIASIIYLAIQIRSNTKIASAQSQRELLNTHEFYNSTKTDPGLANVIRRGLDNFNGLSSDEKVRFNNWLHPVVNQIEACFRMFRQGLIEEESYIGFRDGLVSILITRGAGQWWHYAQNLIGRDFVDEVNGHIETSDSDRPSYVDLLPFFRVEEKDQEK